MEQFYTLLTDIGKAKIANATILQRKLELSKIVVGDSNGNYYEPTEQQTQLKNKVWEGEISNKFIDKDNPNWIVVQTIIPSQIGGFTIREAGIIDAEGDLVVVAKYPETYKPKVEDGSTKDITINLILEVSNVDNVTLKVDPTVILATKTDMDNLEHKVESQMSEMATTYDELKQLKENKKLIPGKRYVLRDYRTKYRQPNTSVIKTMDIEELTLTASSTSTFEPIVSSKTHPKDTIWYDFDNNICEDNSTSRNGFILRRYDPITHNDAPQDWRTILWARYKPHASQYYKDGVLTSFGTWVSGNANVDSLYISGKSLYVARNNLPPVNPTDSRVFEMVYEDINVGLLRDDRLRVPSYGTSRIELHSNELDERLTFGNDCVLNYITPRDGLHNNVFGDSCRGNFLESSCVENTFGNSCSYNNIRSVFQGNTFLMGVQSSSFGSYCLGNTILSGGNNIFGNSCSNNYIGHTFSYNILGNNCRGNVFNYNCSKNVIGNDCCNNNFNEGFTSNYLKSICNNNVFGTSCIYNSFGNNCSENIFGINFNNNILGNNCNKNAFGNYNSSNTLLNNCDTNAFGINNSNIFLFDGCTNNTIGNSKSHISIKRANLVNISNITFASNQNINIERDQSGKYRYWYLDTNGNMNTTLIP